MTSFGFSTQDLFGDSVVVEATDTRVHRVPLRLCFREGLPDGWSDGLAYVGLTMYEMHVLRGQLVSCFWYLEEGIFDSKPLRTASDSSGLNWYIHMYLVSVPPEDSEQTQDVMVMEVIDGGYFAALETPLYAVFDCEGVKTLIASIDAAQEKVSTR